MPSAVWQLEHDRICLVDASGRRIFPAVQQIYSAVFGSVTEVDGVRPENHPVEALTGISFSKYPAEPAIRLHGVPPESISLEFGVRTESGFFPLAQDIDQVIAYGRWYPIDLNALIQARNWLGSMLLNSDSITLGQLISLRTASDVPLFVYDQTVDSSSEVASKAGKNLEEIPHLNAVLYPYQRDGVAFLRLIADQGIGCILADEMGLGKTLQVIALLQSEKNLGKVPSLIVAPATLLENWLREIRLFAPELLVMVHFGAKRAGIAGRFDTFDAVITSFEMVVLDEALLSEVNWDVLVLDEAQNIKNPAAKRTEAVKRLPRRVSLAVTGTPVENRLEDLWSLADFALPNLLGSLEQFRTRFSDDLIDAGHLGHIVAPILLRRRVTEVAQDLPPKIEIPQPVQMSYKMAIAYEDLRLQTLAEHGSHAGIVATTRLRVLCAHPSLSVPWDLDPEHEMPKYRRLLEILSEIFDTGAKVLVFTSFQGIVDLFMRNVPERWPDGFFSFIDGRVPVDARQTTVDRFFSHAGFGALFLNPKAAGTGLNITTANHVIHYNPEWNPAVTDQATGRAYRRKQYLPVTVHHLFFADTIEEVMMDRMSFKRNLAGKAVTGHEGEIDVSVIMRALQISPLSGSKEL